jgi:hypothetical protein
MTQAQHNTAATQSLCTAGVGDVLTGTDLKDAIDWLNAQAGALNEAKKPGVSPDDLQAIAQQQADLRAKATGLIALNIQWLAGQAKLEVEHINDALAYAQGVIDKVKTLKQRLDAIAAVVNFFGSLLTAKKIGDVIAAGTKLKDDLDGESGKA